MIVVCIEGGDETRLVKLEELTAGDDWTVTTCRVVLVR